MRISRKKKRTNRLSESVLARICMLIVTGTYWGDEGKGKIVDFLAGMFWAVVRFSGGAGAGHTLQTPDGRRIIGHLIPCGIARRIMCILARGEYFDLKRFIVEYRKDKLALGGRMPKIAIDHMSPLWTPWHELFEKWVEFALRGGRIDTTGKAIGPLEALFKLRIGLLVGHLFVSPLKLREQLAGLYRVLQPDFDAMVAAGVVRRKDIPTSRQVANELLRLAPQVRDYVTDTASLLHRAWRQGRRIMFEASQAPGLDPQAGTWPFVTAGHCTAAGAPIGTLLPLKAFRRAKVLSVAKACPTRVGNGNFPSEIWSREKAKEFALQHKRLFKKTRARLHFLQSKLEKINAGQATAEDWAQYLQVLGFEVGATTGRGRSVGWLDVQWMSYANRVNGTDYIALTRLDMLSGLKRIPVVVGYRFKGKRLPLGEMPSCLEMEAIEPIIEEWECWPEDITGCRNWSELPVQAKQFIRRLERLLQVPILLIGTGPDREAIIVREQAINRRFHGTGK